MLCKNEFEECRNGCFAYLTLGFFEYSPEMHCILFGNGRIGKEEPILLNSYDRIQNPHFKTSSLPGFSIIQEHYRDLGNEHKCLPAVRKELSQRLQIKIHMFVLQCIQPLRPLAVSTIIPLIQTVSFFWFPRSSEQKQLVRAEQTDLQ